MGRFIFELWRGLKWVGLSILILLLLISAFCGSAWGAGWLLDQFLVILNYGPQKYIAVGSVVLFFILLFQTIAVVITVWLITAYGRTRVKK